MKRTLLLDSDIIAFKIAAVSQTDTAFGRAMEYWQDVTRAIDEYIDDLCEVLEADDLIVCLSCREHNWRNDVWAPYKTHRDHSARPEYLQPLKDYLQAEYPTFLRYSLEADDVMGILSTHPKLVPGEKVIVSEDKDMRTVPGLLYNPRKSDLGIIDVTPLQARQFLCWQAICGDYTDGFKGAPRVGDKSIYAEAVIEADMDELWDIVLEAFGSVRLSETQALENVRCAHILTSGWFDFKRKSVKWFEPECMEIF